MEGWDGLPLFARDWQNQGKERGCGDLPEIPKPDEIPWQRLTSTTYRLTLQLLNRYIKRGTGRVGYTLHGCRALSNLGIIQVLTRYIKPAYIGTQVVPRTNLSREP